MDKPSYEQLAFENELLRKQLNQDPSHLNQLFQLIIEQAEHGIFVVQDSKLKYSNRKFLELLGYKFSDLKEVHFAEFIHPDYREEIIDKFNKILTREIGARDHMEIWVIDDREKEKCLELNLKLVKWDDTKAVMSFVADITEQKQREKAISQAESKLKESLKLRSSLASSLSHEIRTPMTAIIGFTDLLSDPNLSEELRMKYVNYLNRSGNLLLNLIDNIIDMVRMEAGELDIKKRNFQLNSLMDNLYSQYQAELEKTENKNIKLWLKKGKEGNFEINSDADKIRQIISNLLENAFKYTSQGYIEFGYEQLKDNLWKFFVKDTGSGIPEEKQKIIFEQFYEPKEEATRRIGSGLGLTIARQIIEKMGGEIKVESKPGEGSFFYFTLISDETSSKEEVPAKAQKQVKYQWKGKNILVAEDVDTNFVFVEAALRKTKANVIRAENGKEAVEIINNQAVDVVLMDIQMPEMNGYEATRRIVADHPKMPVIAQTAFAMEGEREKSRKAGCVDYLPKPIKLSQLLDTVEKHIYNLEKQ